MRAWPYRLAMAAAAIAVGVVVGWFFTDATWAVLAHPLDRPGDGAPAAFLPRLKLAIIFGFVLTSPIWLHQLLTMTRRGNVRHPVFLGTAILLFGVGCALAYLSLSEGLWLSAGPAPVALITVGEYLDQTLTRILVFGLLSVTPLLTIAIIRVRRLDRCADLNE